MADSTDLNLDDAPSDLQDIPELAMQLVPPPEGTYPDKTMARNMATMWLSSRQARPRRRNLAAPPRCGCVVIVAATIDHAMV
ncbi:hypothetical protein VN97_g304 [Penicillium thymicola]|uniref:Uncharacterized protein n=1 Tax=Penicillium thymicola TaxID=293382 RepID=A0AAI9TV52_PENTH|nr:hypothetical protein VN97_g304 [Penicillium thymicola]